MKKIREVNDQYKEFADPNEKLHKHKTSFAGKRAALFAKGITIASAAVLTFSAVSGSGESLVSGSKPSGENGHPVTSEIGGSNPSSSSFNVTQNGNGTEEILLLDPSIDSLSGVYNYQGETTTIYFGISIKDAESIDSATVTINGQSYPAGVGSSGEVTIQGRLAPGRYSAVLDVGYTINEEKKSMSSSTVVTVNPYVEPAITSASASYNSASDTVSIFASVLANDATITDTRATLSGYWYGIGIGSDGGSGSVNGINFFENGTHSGYVTVTYTINGTEKTISAPISVVISREEPPIIPEPEKKPEPEPVPTPPAGEPTDPEEMERSIDEEEYRPTELDDGKYYEFNSSGAYLLFSYEGHISARTIEGLGIDLENNLDKFSVSVMMNGTKVDEFGLVDPGDPELLMDDGLYVYYSEPKIPLPPPTESGEVEYIVTTVLTYQDDEKIIRFMPITEFSRTIPYNFDGPVTP